MVQENQALTLGTLFFIYLFGICETTFQEFLKDVSYISLLCAMDQPLKNESKIYNKAYKPQTLSWAFKFIQTFGGKRGGGGGGWGGN